MGNNSGWTRRNFLLTSAALAASASSPALAGGNNSLFSQVCAILSRLAPFGWASMFAAHGLEITGLLDERSILEQDLLVDFGQPGFQELTKSCHRAFSPGDPAASLVYHALACPTVVPSTADDGYPTLAEIDTVENYIYSLKRPDSAAMDEYDAVVFAYQYKSAVNTGHGMHADLVFSRTAISRFGNESAQYDARRRCFAPEGSAPDKVRVMPSRVGLFLVPKNARSADTAIVDARKNNLPVLSGVAPVYKLFDGSECIVNRTLQLKYLERHVNEKLARAFDKPANALKNSAGYNLHAPPFRFDSAHDPFTDCHKLGASWQVGTLPAKLIEIATMSDGTAATARISRDNCLFRMKRRYTSAHMFDSIPGLIRDGLNSGLPSAFDQQPIPPYKYPNPRNGPEFINIRHTLPKGQGKGLPADVVNMLKYPVNRSEFIAATKRAHDFVLFHDGSAEGVVSATIEGAGVSVKPLYSIIAPPDILPYASQLEIYRYTAPRGTGASRLISQGAADPLCFGNLPPNPALLNPATERAAFSQADTGIVTIVSRAARMAGEATAPYSSVPVSSFMTDAATNIFAPGWDVTYGGKGSSLYYTTAGLGSPFPEDVKLCAAANAMWPAVVPDTSRTFGRLPTPTSIPMMDDELGLHPDNPLFNGDAARGWDGEYGPFLTADGLAINYADIERSDYVANLREGLWRFDKVARVDGRQAVVRMNYYLRAIGAVDAFARDFPAFTHYWLVSALPVNDWSRDPRGADNRELKGSGFRFILAIASQSDGNDRRNPQTEPGRRLAPLVDGKKVMLALVDADRVVLVSSDPGPRTLDLYR